MSRSLIQYSGCVRSRRRQTWIAAVDGTEGPEKKQETVGELSAGREDSDVTVINFGDKVILEDLGPVIGA